MDTTMMELRSKRSDGKEQEEEELSAGLSALIEAATSQLGHLVGDTEDLPQLSASLGVAIEAHHSFPERLMRLCSNPEYINIITFLPDGKFFAIREEAFCESGLLSTTFDDLSTFDHFVTRAKEWGFSKLGSDGIAIFRHPSFQLGQYDQCSAIQFGETPKTVRLQALQQQEDTSPSSTSSSNTTAQQSKRRLSPRTRRESLSSLTSKPRVDDCTLMPPAVAANTTTAPQTPSLKEGDGTSGGKALMDEDSVRSVAMAITTDRLKLKQAEDDDDRHNKTLVETAVSSATQEIVTDAIETLLRDEGHSKETFLKHEKELSRSSIPGVVPVCKQLFCSTYKDALQIVAMDQSSPTRVVTADEGANAPEPDEQEDDHVLKEASNSPSTTRPTLSVDDNIKGMPKSIPEIL